MIEMPIDKIPIHNKQKTNFNIHLDSTDTTFPLNNTCYEKNGTKTHFTLLSPHNKYPIRRNPLKKTLFLKYYLPTPNPRSHQHMHSQHSLILINTIPNLEYWKMYFLKAITICPLNTYHTHPPQNTHPHHLPPPTSQNLKTLPCIQDIAQPHNP